MKLVIHASSRESQSKKIEDAGLSKKKNHCTSTKIVKFTIKRASSKQQIRSKRILINTMEFE